MKTQDQMAAKVTSYDKSAFSCDLSTVSLLLKARQIKCLFFDKIRLMWIKEHKPVS